MVFEFVLYSFAVISVLTIVGSHKRDRAVAVVVPNLFVDEPREAQEEGVFTCDASAADAALVDAHSAIVSAYWTNRSIDNVVPFVRPVKPIVATPDWEGMNAVQLRAECQRFGIRWSKVNGGKHLTKAQMIDRLRARRSA